MIDRDYTFWVTEKLLGSTDLSDKKQTLKEHTEQISDYDEELVDLVDEIIVDGQKGDIVDALEEKTEKLKKHNQELLEDTDERIDKMVTHLNEQVEDSKEQRMKITYQDPLTSGLQ